MSWPCLENVSDLFTASSLTPNAAWLIGADRTGVLEEIAVPDKLPDWAVDLSFNVKAGDSVRKFASGRDRIGQLIVKGSSARDCREKIVRLLQDIVIKVK